MGFCEYTTKAVVKFFNFVCVIVGISCFGIGKSIYGTCESFDVLLGGKMYIMTMMLIVAGSVIIPTVVFGCYAYASHIMLKIYAVTLSILVAVQFVSGAMTFVFRETFEGEYNKTIELTYNNYYNDENMKNIVDKFQKEVHCCGLNGPDSWTNGSLPTSCCSLNNTQLQCKINEAFKDGCERAISKTAKGEFDFLFKLAMISSTIELIAVFFIFCLSLLRSHQSSYDTLSDEDRFILE